MVPLIKLQYLDPHCNLFFQHNLFAKPNLAKRIGLHGDLKSYYLKSRVLQDRISNAPVVQEFDHSKNKTSPFEIWTFLSGFQMILKKGQSFVQILNGGLQDFRSHSQAGPFTLFDYFKSRLYRFQIAKTFTNHQPNSGLLNAKIKQMTFTVGA